MHELQALLIVLALAYLLGEACKHLKIPRAVGQVLAGLIIGTPLLRAMFLNGESLSIFSFMADIGIILLFFFVGLEISIGQFRKHFKESSLISLFNTSIPFLAGIGFGLYSGLNFVQSTILGISLSVSSQAVAIDFLEEFNLLKSRIGQLVIAAGAVDDIFELILITAVLTFVSASITQSNILFLIAGVFGFILATFLILKFLLKPLLAFFEEENNQSNLFAGAIIIMLFVAVVSNFFGIESIIGALFAGMLLRHIMLKGAKKEVWREHFLAHTVHVVSFGLFVPVFFVMVGVEADIHAILGNLPFGIAITLIALLGTLIGTMLGVKLSKGSWKEGFVVGWGLNAKGDTEIVIATLALSAGVITKDLYSAIIFMAVATTIISPILFRKFCASMRRQPQKPQKR